MQTRICITTHDLHLYISDKKSLNGKYLSYPPRLFTIGKLMLQKINYKKNSSISQFSINNSSLRNENIQR